MVRVPYKLFILKICKSCRWLDHSTKTCEQGLENQSKEKETPATPQSTTSKEKTIMETNKRDTQRKSFSCSSPSIQFKAGESSSSTNTENPFELTETSSNRSIFGPIKKNVVEVFKTSTQIIEKTQHHGKLKPTPKPNLKPNQKQKNKGGQSLSPNEPED